MQMIMNIMKKYILIKSFNFKPINLILELINESIFYVIKEWVQYVKISFLFSVALK